MNAQDVVVVGGCPTLVLALLLRLFFLTALLSDLLFLPALILALSAGLCLSPTLLVSLASGLFLPPWSLGPCAWSASACLAGISPSSIVRRLLRRLPDAILAVVFLPTLRVSQCVSRHVQLNHAPMGIRRLIDVGMVLLCGGGVSLLDLFRSRVVRNIEQVVVCSCLGHLDDSTSPALLNVNGRGDGDGFWPSPE